MKTTSIRDLLARQPVLSDLEPADIDLIAGCAHIEVVEPGTFLAREGDPADRFFVLRAGKVALALQAPTGPLVVETLGPGDLVGWSWLFPPRRFTYDIEAVEHTRMVTVEATCLVAKCEQDPAFGYRVMKRFSQVLVERLYASAAQAPRPLRGRVAD